ncbi:hypothetical protein HDA41_006100 [Streptomyces caelestis]|uniref:Uncharacterized protein n=1 Tax=Streptomyces caelestis TaxID=36816 RepID=A0A7W9H9Y1_9ACTN|nr:hypothetical protein [Streptomyces caelestis]
MTFSAGLARGVAPTAPGTLHAPSVPSVSCRCPTQPGRRTS